jgi:hypothetical protein
MNTTETSVVDELKRLAATNGGELRPIDVVTAARSPESPLHTHFDWDDSDAADKWRLHQARLLIRVVVAYEPVADGRNIPHRVFVSLTPHREDGTGYRLTTDVLSDPDLRRQLLTDARAEMKRFTQKYKQLDELALVFAAMESIEEEHSIPA